MEDTLMIEIVTPNGYVDTVNLITYLVSDDGVRRYVVYSRNEVYENESDRIIYISRLTENDNILNVSEIEDDVEWNEVQRLLRRIANTASK
ncbi:MAG: DUF1292 domain-containing protein [Bacilli bacterium]|nr:DUF1292 domain-containing protein [Bacilli bacterium]